MHVHNKGDHNRGGEHPEASFHIFRAEYSTTSTRLAAFVIAVVGATAAWAEAQPAPPVNGAILDALNSIQSVANEINSKVDSIQVSIVTNATVCRGVYAFYVHPTVSAFDSIVRRSAPTGNPDDPAGPAR
jgi:hypothetical protein